MRLYPPIPYPDELLYSVNARYSDHAGIIVPSKLCIALTDRLTSVNAHIPISISIMAEKTFLAWGLSSNDLLQNHTMYPYYTRYVNDVGKSRYKEYYELGNMQTSDFKPGGFLGLLKPPRTLRFCKICKALDMESYGEAYWHRIHQLSGALVCPVHGEELISTQSRIVHNAYLSYANASNAKEEHCQIGAILNNIERERAFLVAKRCQEILNGTMTRWHLRELTNAYREAASARGFVDGSLYISQNKIREAFRTYFGDKLLARYGLNLTDNSCHWIKRLFTNDVFLANPAAHALMQTFLENTAEVRTSHKVRFSAGPWKCPNKYAHHKEPFPLKRHMIIYRTNNRNEVEALATCNCGFCFIFSETDAQDAAMPIIARISRFGPTWKSEAARLRKKGYTFRTIGEIMGTDASRVCQLLKRKFRSVSKLQIKQWRKEWLATIDSLSEQRYVGASRKNPSIYRKLKRHDSKWLLSTNDKRRKSVKNFRGKKVD